MVRTCLVDREDERLCNVDVCGPVSGPDDLLCNILARQRLQTLVYLVRSPLVAPKPGHRERSLDHAWLNLGHPDGRVHELLQERRGERIDSKLGCAVNRSTWIALPPSNGAEVDNVTRVALLELLDKDLSEVNETLDVGVDHDVDLVCADVSNFVSAKDEASVVDEDVDVFGPFWEVVDDAIELLAVLHVECDSSKVATGTSLAGLVGSSAFLGSFGELIGSTSSEDDVAASTGEEDGSGLADTARCTGDEHGLVVQALSWEYGCHAGKDSVGSAGRV